MGGRRRVSRRMVALVLVGLLQVLVVVSLTVVGPDDTTHRAPIRISAPPVVAATIVDQANALPGTPFVARGIPTAAQARRSVQEGRSVGAVVVDLAKDTDVLYVASANGTRLDATLRREVGQLSADLARTVEVRNLVPARAGDADHRGVYALAGVAILLGFLIALVVTWVRGPMATTLVRGVVRVAVVGGIAVALGVVVAAVGAHRYGSGLPTWWLILGLTILAAAMTTLALESVFGAAGLGVATTVFVLAAAPLLTLEHPLLLPQPWSAITPWLPHGAALAAGTNEAYFGGGQLVRPLLVLATWTVLSVVTISVARRERRRDDVPFA